MRIHIQHRHLLYLRQVPYERPAQAPVVPCVPRLLPNQIQRELMIISPTLSLSLTPTNKTTPVVHDAMSARAAPAILGGHEPLFRAFYPRPIRRSRSPPRRLRQTSLRCRSVAIGQSNSHLGGVFVIDTNGGRPEPGGKGTEPRLFGQTFSRNVFESQALKIRRLNSEPPTKRTRASHCIPFSPPTQFSHSCSPPSPITFLSTFLSRSTEMAKKECKCC